MRVGAFELKLVRSNGDPMPERMVENRAHVLAAPGESFEAEVHNHNEATYMVRLVVDGTEAEPGWMKKLRGGSSTRFRGYLCGRDVHEFMFAKTPVDEKASRAAGEGVGEVRVLIFATRRVRVDESSSDEEAGHKSSAAIGVRALPEKAAIKELGVQARPGSCVERIQRRRGHRRGEYRLEKVCPEVATLSLFYRDDFWWQRRRAARETSTANPRATSSSKSAPAPEPAPLKVKREPGETGRGLDGKRRKRAAASANDEVIELSD
mmetsp:Transcript_59158/g.135681  ORF Transcript_59158/g.135681 Transcript_59158/m.135681 type:complete len:265 (-) Transcript_59158:184-978(-)|eukprot:CAMPEP_0119358258 /NCGR_PEP_ID=MMETSP1334-20130426/6501_1 /TAXON_ID=127549 /ORGANISM="Calcidiscus leptoporus, Strain RCC1130" /LENGTH=264 /DNA_ID=CAMNT_0007372705 /DNA_START=69 /DNA_END=863 /DNA_ORIENTATION=-